MVFNEHGRCRKIHVGSNKGTDYYFLKIVKNIVNIFMTFTGVRLCSLDKKRKNC